MATENKPAVKSTQNWMNVGFVGLVALIPEIQEFFQANPEWLAGTFGLVNIVWRTFITKKPVSGVF